MKSKKGQIFATITVGTLLVVALIIVLVFGGAAFMTWFLTNNIFVIIGSLMIIFFVIGFIRGRFAPMWLWIIALALIVLPFIIEGMKNLTLGAVIT